MSSFFWHGSRDWFARLHKGTTKNFLNILLLAKKEEMLTMVNFNTKEMVKEPQVFDGEFLTKFSNEPIDVIGIITSDHHIINIEE